MMASWLVVLGILLWHTSCTLSWKIVKSGVIQTRLHVVVPQKPPAEAEAVQEPEKEKPRWNMFGRPVYPSDMFPRMKRMTEEGTSLSLPSPLINILNNISKKGKEDMDEVANFFSSARYGISKEVEAKEMDGKEMKTKVSDIMKDLE